MIARRCAFYLSETTICAVRIESSTEFSGWSSASLRSPRSASRRVPKRRCSPWQRSRRPRPKPTFDIAEFRVLGTHVLPRDGHRAGGLPLSRAESQHRHRQAGGRCARESVQAGGLRRGVRRYPGTGSGRRHRAAAGHRGQARVRARARRALLFPPSDPRGPAGAADGQVPVAPGTAEAADRAQCADPRSGGDAGAEGGFGARYGRRRSRRQGYDAAARLRELRRSAHRRHHAEPRHRRPELRQSLAAPGHGRPHVSDGAREAERCRGRDRQLSRARGLDGQRGGLLLHAYLQQRPRARNARRARQGHDLWRPLDQAAGRARRPIHRP